MNRAGGALLLGAGVTAAALAFGSRPLAVVGAGLLLAAALTQVWAGLARSAIEVTTTVQPSPAVEGDRVRLDFAVRRRSRMRVGSAVVHLDLGRLGRREASLRGHGRMLSGELDLGLLPRGSFGLAGAALDLGDHLGLASITLRVATTERIVVYPRLVELQGLFSDTGSLGESGRRLLLRRAAGFDFHSVRAYEQGESLRRVHWPTSARRGELMVRELHDTPHDGVVVLLDCDPAGATGEPPDSSFDAAVRAAGSVLRAYAIRGRAATLVTTGSNRSTVIVRAARRDFDAALAALAAAEADASHPLSRYLGADETALLRAGEIVVVTSVLAPATVAALLRTANRRPVSVIWVDAPSFVERPTRADPGALRLSTSGVPVAVVRRGDDLAGALGARAVEALARA